MSLHIFKEISPIFVFLCVCVLGSRLGKASGLLRPGTRWVGDEDSAIWYRRRLDGHDRGRG